MKISGNTILITGGGSGIGRALAEEFAARGNKVIITGRRLALLQQVAAGHDNIEAAELDLQNPDSIREFAARLVADHPDLNAVINNAGIMQNENLLAGEPDLSVAEATITTNLLGPIRLITALLPHLRRQRSAVVLTVSSGLAFLPLTATPTYCATKAAIHSYSQSLRYQLRETGVQVIEIVPPYVQTELQGEAQASDPRAMPLPEFIAEVMKLIEENPSIREVLVEKVKPLRFAAENGGYEAFFVQLNQAMAAHSDH